MPIRTLIPSLAITLATTAVSGQANPTENRAEDAAQPLDQRIEDAEALVPRPPGDIEAFSPIKAETTSPVRPGLTGGSDWARMLEPTWPGVLGSPLLPERSFVNSLRGTVLRGPRDTRVFVPARAPAVEGLGDGKTEPPRAMLLLPCTELERFNTYAFSEDPSAAVLLTGQVFLYGDRNYILPTGLRRAAGDIHAPPEQPAEPITEPAQSPESTGQDRETREADPTTDNPDVSALMAELERRTPIARPPAAQTTADTDSAGASPSVPVSDGNYIAARRGRVIRTPEGSWSFVRDSDESGPARATSYTLLPCRTLEALEHRALYHGDTAAGLMSGRVYRFGGHEYLLPTLYQIERRDGVDPLQ